VRKEKKEKTPKTRVGRLYRRGRRARVPPDHTVALGPVGASQNMKSKALRLHILGKIKSVESSTSNSHCACRRAGLLLLVSAKWPVRELQSRPADATGTPTSDCDNRPACGYNVLHPLKTYRKTTEYTKNLLQYRTMFCASCSKYSTPSSPLDAFRLCTHYTNHRNKQLAKTRSIPEMVLFITLSALVS